MMPTTQAAPLKNLARPSPAIPPMVSSLFLNIGLSFLFYPHQLREYQIGVLDARIQSHEFGHARTKHARNPAQRVTGLRLIPHRREWRRKQPPTAYPGRTRTL